ncbi:MAG: hypothetical protein EOM65_00745 [Synergistales bacterium]|nr:hypothetical protein [Synergistales bacterium]
MSVFTSKGMLEGRDLDEAVKLAGSVTKEGECKAAYLAGASLLRKGEYDRGREFMLKALDGCYDLSVNFWGDMERLRTIAAGELALHAGTRGDYRTIIAVEEKVAKDIATDRLLVRDAKCILQGRTKLGDILKFHKARAYQASKMTADAKTTLNELQFASGKVFVDGEVVGLKDAISKLQLQVDGAAFLPFLKAV